jgi:hypothetical protein
MKRASRNQVKPMTVRQPRYSKEEFTRRGDEIYESQVRSQIDEESDRSKIVGVAELMYDIAIERKVGEKQ